MTRQVPEGQPITVTLRGDTGGVVTDATLKIDGNVYSDPECKKRINVGDRVTNGAGDFVFYGKAGDVFTFDHDIEPIQVVGVAERPGGLAAVHPEDTPEVHEESPISEHLVDSALVGAPPFRFPEDEGGALAATRVAEAEDIPPGEPADVTTPDGTTATDPDAAQPTAVAEEQVTPQYEAVPDPEAGTRLEPQDVTEVDPPEPADDSDKKSK